MTEEQEYQDYLEYQEYLESQDESEKSGLLKGTLEALPAAGSMFGGAAGLVSPIPGGAYTGAALGAATGKALENLGERYLLDESKTTQEVISEPITEAAFGAATEGLGAAINVGLKAAGKGLKKISSKLSGVPEKAIETYIERPSEVKAVGKISEETSLQDAADNLRKEVLQSINDFKSEANSNISFILMEKGDNAVPTDNIKKIGNNIISKLNPKIEADAIQAEKIKRMINQIEALEDANGKMKTSDMHRMKQILQDAVDYDPVGNVIYKKDIAEITFQRMAEKARENVELIAPEIKSINQQLKKLHNINKNMNKNLISPEKASASVMAVGSGENQQAIKQMRKLEEVTGYPYVSRAQEISAARYFNSPSPFPVDTTGRSVLAGTLGMGPLMTGIATNSIPMMATGASILGAGSPMVIKSAIDIGKPVVKGVQTVSPYLTGPIKGMAQGSMFDSAKQLMNEALMQGIPPFMIEDEIKRSPLKPTEKAQLRKAVPK